MTRVTAVVIYTVYFRSPLRAHFSLTTKLPFFRSRRNNDNRNSWFDSYRFTTTRRAKKTIRLQVNRKIPSTGRFSAYTWIVCRRAHNNNTVRPYIISKYILCVRQIIKKKNNNKQYYTIYRSSRRRRDRQTVEDSCRRGRYRRGETKKVAGPYGCSRFLISVKRIDELLISQKSFLQGSTFEPHARRPCEARRSFVRIYTILLNIIQYNIGRYALATARPTCFVRVFSIPGDSPLQHASSRL